MIQKFTHLKIDHMKRFLQISGLALLVMLFAGLKNPVAAQPGGEVSYQDFYDELSPYGRWIEYPEYGYVWCPDEGGDFRPYSTNGRWVWSDDYEWMWVSDYSWGWAPFHYGRWFYDDLYGWMWVPGYDWSPAWVAWRGGGDYYGWAPLWPGVHIGIGFSIGSYQPPINYWCFAPSRYITSPRIYDYCVSSRQNVTIINNTTIINNYNYNRNVFVTGPRRNDVERYTNQRITPVRLRDISAPNRAGFRNNEVAIYRPSVQRNSERSFAPRRFDNYRRSNGNDVVRRDLGRDNGRNIERRNDNNIERRDVPNVERRSIPNNDRIDRNNNVDRSFDRRRANPNNEQIRERSARDVFGRDNRRGIDQPVRRNNFERREEPIRNDVRSRNDNNDFNRRDNNNFNRRIERENQPVRQERRELFNNRNNDQPREQRRSAPEFNQRQQPQQQPRRFEQSAPSRGNSGDNNHGRGFDRRRG